MADSERSRSRSSSVSSSSTILSTISAKEVGMNKVQRTSEKKMRIVGVNGCTSMHLFGSNFIVGAHAAPNMIPDIAQQGADLAGQGVTSIVVWAPAASYGNEAVTALQGHYPQAQITPHYYVMDESRNPGWWEFVANQGNPGVVFAKHVPGS